MAAKIKNKQADEEEIIFEEETGEGSSKSSQQGASFFEKYRNVIYGAGIVILGAVFFFIYRSNQNKAANVEGQEAMVMTVATWEQDSMKVVDQPSAAIPSLEDIKDEYGGTSAGNLATYYAGIAYLKLGRIDDGVEYLEEFSGEGTMAEASALYARGYAAEEQNDFEAAGDLYEKASRTPAENIYTTPMYLKEAGRAYESAGNKEKANEVYKKIKADYPLSPASKDIDLFIGRTWVGGNE